MRAETRLFLFTICHIRHPTAGLLKPDADCTHHVVSHHHHVVGEGEESRQEEGAEGCFKYFIVRQIIKQKAEKDMRAKSEV